MKHTYGYCQTLGTIIHWVCIDIGYVQTLGPHVCLDINDNQTLGMFRHCVIFLETYITVILLLKTNYYTIIGRMKTTLWFEGILATCSHAVGIIH